MHKRVAGFTIVELLIVIVVIAILAAITLVSYQGVQQRARNSVTISAANAWINLLTASYTVNGTITIDFQPDWNGGVCLGNPADYSKPVGGLEAGECFPNFFADDELYEKLSQVGNASMQPYGFDIGNGKYTRGIQYSFEDDGHAYLYYDLMGKQDDCGISGVFSTQSSENTASTDCKIDMNDKLGAQPIDFEFN